MFASIVQRLVDYVTRRRTSGQILLRTGLALLLAAQPTLWVFYFDVSLPSPLDQLTFGVQESWISIITFMVTLGLGATALVSGIFLLFIENRRTDRRRIVVVELRGLRDVAGTPLIDAIPDLFVGRPEPLTIDLRQNIVDGELVEPQAALKIIESVPQLLATRIHGLDRSDFDLIIGGIAPVPLLFLLGVLIDDEGKATLLDWDRHIGDWRELNNEINQIAFTEPHITQFSGSHQEVILGISVSYTVNETTIRELKQLPFYHLEIPNGSPESHWSEQTQISLGKKFLETVKRLEKMGVQTIHLFLACPSSVAIRFGRLYDKRNLPALKVYQYQRSADGRPPYPWLVEMPVGGCLQAKIEYVPEKD